MKLAKLFQNGQSQAIRLPKEFQFEGTEVYIQKIGHTTVITPVENPWAAWQRSLDLFSNDFMNDRQQPPVQDRDCL